MPYRIPIAKAENAGSIFTVLGAKDVCSAWSWGLHDVPIISLQCQHALDVGLYFGHFHFSFSRVCVSSSGKWVCLVEASRQTINFRASPICSSLIVV